MGQDMFNRGSLPILEQTLYFTTARHRVLANNIANINTPFYKAIDLPEKDFKDALQRAIEERDRRPVPVFELKGIDTIRPKAGGGLDIDPIESPDAGILTHSENNVDIDKEQAKIVQNGMLHNFVATLLSQQFSMLKEAISGRIQ